jgi:hypothetical protein
LDFGAFSAMPVLVSRFDCVVRRFSSGVSGSRAAAFSAASRSRRRLLRRRSCGSGFEAAMSSAFSISPRNSSMEKSALPGRADLRSAALYHVEIGVGAPGRLHAGYR